MKLKALFLKVPKSHFEKNKISEEKCFSISQKYLDKKLFLDNVPKSHFERTESLKFQRFFLLKIPKLNFFKLKIPKSLDSFKNSGTYVFHDRNCNVTKAIF